jgi:transposase
MHLIETVVDGTKYIYANECVYHRETGKSSNVAKCIGKINENKKFAPNKFLKQILLLFTSSPASLSNYEKMILDTATAKYGHEVMLTNANEQDEETKVLKIIQTAQPIRYGPQLVFGDITKTYGLESMLTESFGVKIAQHIVSLSWFITSEGSALSNNDSWLSYYENPNNGGISSQNVTRLLDDIHFDGMMTFYKLWLKKIGGKTDKTEKILYDLTSISYYGKRIPEAEYGHNKDKDGLLQINYALLCIRSTGMPLFAWPMNGSISDIVTLETTLEFLLKLGYKPNCLMMDRGFASRTNISFMFTKKHIFLQTLKTNSVWVHDIIDFERNERFLPHNQLEIGNQTYYGTTSDCKWVIYRNQSQKDSPQEILVYPCRKRGDRYVNEDEKVEILDQYSCKAHVFFCQDLVGSHFDKFMKNLGTEYDRLVADENAVVKKEFQKYFSTERKKYARKRRVEYVKERILEYKDKYAGYICYLTNDPSIKTAEDALKEYSTRDQIEKDFDELKNTEDMKRLRVWDGDRMRSRLFIQFIAEIHMRELCTRLRASKECRKLTKTQISNHIKTICKIKFKGKYRDVKHPFTKSQRNIIHAMGISPP